MNADTLELSVFVSRSAELSVKVGLLVGFVVSVARQSELSVSVERAAFKKVEL